jgi:hypothetical protein
VNKNIFVLFVWLEIPMRALQAIFLKQANISATSQKLRNFYMKRKVKTVFYHTA